MIWKDQMEQLLEKEFRRLFEILEDLGPIGKELETYAEKFSHSASQEELGQQAVDRINQIRMPGFCAFQLTQEASILVYLIAVKISSLRSLYDKAKDSKQLAQLKSYEDAINEVEPELSRSLENLKPYSTLDSRKVVESIISSYKKHPA